MTAFLAIVKLTCKSAVRSHVFQILLGILIFTIMVLPLSVVGDGTAHSYIQISLQYCLGAISFLLSISTIWLGCFTMASDVENYQLHMVITKPISRITIWLGKFVGVIVIHTVLLIISSLMVYAFILLQFYYPGFISQFKFPIWLATIGAAALSVGVFFFNFIMKKEWVYKLSFILLISSAFLLVIHYLIPKEGKQHNFTAKEKERISNEVLVGRRVFMPEIPNLNKITKEIYKNHLAELLKQNKIIPEQHKQMLKKEIAKQVLASIGEVYPGKTYLWQYKDLKIDEDTPLFLRYRVYVGRVSTKSQRQTMGLWGAKVIIKIPINPVARKKTAKKQEFQTRAVFSPRTKFPENIMCGTFNEIKMTSNVIDEKGQVVIGFANYDPQGKKLFFQQADGPKLLIKVSSFLENYSRAVFMIFAKIVALAGLSCALGGLISIPVAMFTVFSYLLFGFFSSYVIGFGTSGGTLYDIVGYTVSSGLMLVIIPMQDFDVSHLLAGGEIIELSSIAKILIFNVLIKCLIVMALGVWLYCKREMGLVVRK